MQSFPPLSQETNTPLAQLEQCQPHSDNEAMQDATPIQDHGDAMYKGKNKIEYISHDQLSFYISPSASLKSSLSHCLRC